MKQLSIRFLLAAGLIAALSFASVAQAATRSHTTLKTDQPSFHYTGDKTVGIGYLGYWNGGIDITGSYFFTNNIAARVDIAPVTYTFPGVAPVSVLYIDVMGVYHMAFNDTIGGYAGLGLGMGSATNGGVTVAASGLAYTVGAEMFFSDNIKGHLGILSGGLNLGVDMLF